MKTNGETIYDVQIMEKILWNLVERFDGIKESIDFNTMIIDGLQGSLEAYEQRLDENTTTVVEQGLKTQMNVKKKGWASEHKRIKLEKRLRW